MFEGHWGHLTISFLPLPDVQNSHPAYPLLIYSFHFYITYKFQVNANRYPSSNSLLQGALKAKFTYNDVWVVHNIKPKVKANRDNVVGQVILG